MTKGSVLLALLLLVPACSAEYTITRTVEDHTAHLSMEISDGQATEAYSYTYPKDEPLMVDIGMNSTFALFNTTATEKIDGLLFDRQLIEQEYVSEGKVPIIIKLKERPRDQRVRAIGPSGTLLSNLWAMDGAVKHDLELIGSVSADVPYADVAKVASLGEVERVYLDKKVQILLDDSVPLINGTVIQSLGINGTGVTIAIVDTGVDATHPDLDDIDDNGQAKVVKFKDYVNSRSTAYDDHGHGTHCAGIAAGTGNASAGQYKGVAPSAYVWGAKVLNKYGSGATSKVIAGIQWATDPNSDGDYSDRADIISLSLGMSVNGDGTDSLSLAVDQAVSRGTVVAAAAGNSGSSRSTVGQPAVARNIITVGSSTKADQISSFSSRGPTTDFRIKPEVLAPGSSITAPRGTGTSMGSVVDEYYTSASGTSMATPHVAGASALILQKNPTWSPADVKSALVITAKDLGLDAFDQGSGRIDVHKAANTPILVDTPVINFGKVATGQSNATITIRNVNDSEIDVSLAVGNATEDGGSRYNISSLNVSFVRLPAGGNASVLLSVDTGGIEGTFFGAVELTARNATYRVPYAIIKYSTLIVNVLDANGNGLSPIYITAHNDDLSKVERSSRGGSRATFSMPAGNCTAHAIGDDGVQAIRYILTGRTEIPSGGVGELNLSIADANVINATARSLDNETLDLYFTQYGIKETYGSRSSASIVGWVGFGFYGDRIVYISNTTDEPAGPKTWIEYYGVPSRGHKSSTWYDVEEKRWLEETYSLGRGLYLMGWALHNVSSDQILNYSQSDLAYYNYTYNFPGTTPRLGASHSNNMPNILFWSAPDSLMSVSIWYYLAMPLERMVYMMGDSWSYLNYIYINYLKSQDWRNEFALTYSQKETKVGWARYQAGGYLGKHYYGSPPYKPMSLSNSNHGLGTSETVMTDRAGSVEIYKKDSANWYSSTGESGELTIPQPTAEWTRNGTVYSSDDSVSWLYYTKYQVSPRTISSVYGQYTFNLTIPLLYPVWNSTNVYATFSYGDDENPPMLDTLEMLPRYTPGSPLPIRFTLSEANIANATVAYRHEGADWTESPLTANGTIFNGTITVSNTSVSEIDLRIYANDTYDNTVTYTIAPGALRGRNVTLSLAASTTDVDPGDGVTFTGTCIDSESDVCSDLRIDYYWNSQFIESERTYKDGTLSFEYTIPNTYDYSVSNFYAKFAGTGAYAPVVESIRFGQIIDTLAPAYSSLSSVPTPDANDNITLSSVWTDANTTVGTVFFEANYTGTFANYTTSRSGSSYSYTIREANTSANQNISYRFIANDTSNNWNVSMPYYSFVVSSISTSFTIGENASLLRVNESVLLWCDYIETGAGDVLGANVSAEVNGSSHSMSYNASNGRYETNYTAHQVGSFTWTCTASKTDHQSQQATDEFVVAEEDMQWSGLNQSSATVNEGENVTVRVFWSSAFNLTEAWVGTNRTGSWGRVSNMSLSANETWSNFTLGTSGYPNKQIHWRLYARATTGTVAVTNVSSFYVQDLTAPHFANLTYHSSLGLGRAQDVLINVNDIDVVEKVWILVNGSNQTMEGSNPYTYNYTPTLVGEANITIFANDSSNNLNQTSFTFTVADSGAPALRIVSPSAGEISSNFTLNISVSDASGLAKVWYVLDNGSNVTLSSPYNTTLSIDSWAENSTHTIHVFANDTTGLQNYTNVSGIIKDTIVALNITSPLNNSKHTTSDLVVEYTFDDAVSIEIVLDDGSYTDQTIDGYHHLTNVSDSNTHELRIRGTDALNNTGVSSTISFGVDTLSPALSNLEHTQKVLQNRSNDIAITVTEANIDTVRIDIGDINASMFRTTPIGNFSVGLLTSTDAISYIYNYTNMSELGFFNFTIYANDTYGHSVSTSSQFEVMVDPDAPVWSNQQQSASTVNESETVVLSAEWYDFQLDAATLETNRAGEWTNESVKFTTNVSSFSFDTTLYPARNISWRIYANDTSGNINVTDIMSFYVRDITLPRLWVQLIPPVVTQNGQSTIRAIASDNVNVSRVWGTVETTPVYNLTFVDDLATFNDTDTVGSYLVTVYANDTSNNLRNLTRYLQVRPSTRLVINATGRSGRPAQLKFSLNHDNDTVSNFSTTTAVNISIGEGIAYTLNITAENETVKIIIPQVNITANITIAPRYEPLQRSSFVRTPSVGVLHNKSFAFDPNVTGGDATVCLSYLNMTYSTASNLKLFKCGWDFTTEACTSDWEQLTTTVNTSLMEVCAEVTSFSAFSVGERPYSGDGVCEDSESCSISDCTSASRCQVSSGGGGGSVGTFILSTLENITGEATVSEGEAGVDEEKNVTEAPGLVEEIEEKVEEKPKEVKEVPGAPKREAAEVLAEVEQFLKTLGKEFLTEEAEAKLEDARHAYLRGDYELAMRLAQEAKLLATKREITVATVEKVSFYNVWLIIILLLLLFIYPQRKHLWREIELSRERNRQNCPKRDKIKNMP